MDGTILITGVTGGDMIHFTTAGIHL